MGAEDGGTQTRFEPHIVRTTDSGSDYEDTIDYLSVVNAGLLASSLPWRVILSTTSTGQFRL